MRAASKTKNRKTHIYNNASIDHTEHCYNIVISHLRRNNTLTKTYAKFPPKAIYSAVKQVLERSPREPLDLAVTFESLRDYSTVESFITSLTERHELNKDIDVEGYEYALTELEEHAEILGLKLLQKNEVAVNKNEYYYLLRCANQLKALKKLSDGWPLGLC